MWMLVILWLLMDGPSSQYVGMANQSEPVFCKFSFDWDAVTFGFSRGEGSFYETSSLEFPPVDHFSLISNSICWRGTLSHQSLDPPAIMQKWLGSLYPLVHAHSIPPYNQSVLIPDSLPAQPVEKCRVHVPYDRDFSSLCMAIMLFSVFYCFIMPALCFYRYHLLAKHHHSHDLKVEGPFTFSESRMCATLGRSHRGTRPKLVIHSVSEKPQLRRVRLFQSRFPREIRVVASHPVSNSAKFPYLGLIMLAVIGYVAHSSIAASWNGPMLGSLILLSMKFIAFHSLAEKLITCVHKPLYGVKSVIIALITAWFVSSDVLPWFTQFSGIALAAVLSNHVFALIMFWLFKVVLGGTMAFIIVSITARSVLRPVRMMQSLVRTFIIVFGSLIAHLIHAFTCLVLLSCVSRHEINELLNHGDIGGSMSRGMVRSVRGMLTVSRASAPAVCPSSIRQANAADPKEQSEKVRVLRSFLIIAGRTLHRALLPIRRVLDSLSCRPLLASLAIIRAALMIASYVLIHLAMPLNHDSSSLSLGAAIVALLQPMYHVCLISAIVFCFSVKSFAMGLGIVGTIGMGLMVSYPIAATCCGLICVLSIWFLPLVAMTVIKLCKFSNQTLYTISVWMYSIYLFVHISGKLFSAILLHLLHFTCSSNP